MLKCAPHELPGGQDILTDELQEECLLWPLLPILTSDIQKSQTLLLFMGCGPQPEADMGKVTGLYLSMKMHFQVKSWLLQGCFQPLVVHSSQIPPSSPHGTEQRPTIPPSHPMPHCYPVQTMSGEGGTSPAWFIFLLGKISNLLLAQ